MSPSDAYELIRSYIGKDMFAIQQDLTQAELGSVVDMIGEDAYTLNGNLKGKPALMKLILEDMS